MIRYLMIALSMLVSYTAWGVDLSAFRDNYFVVGQQEPGTGKNIAKFQLSVETPVMTWLSAHYTQKAFWDILETSSPFREHDYEPGMFGHWHWDQWTFRVGHMHESTGVGGENSRSWERSYIAILYDWSFGAVEVMRWNAWPYALWENRDIVDYQGNVETRINLHWRSKVLLDSTFRIRSRTHGLTWNLGTFGVYAHHFSGVGEGLVGYDQHTESNYIGVRFAYGN